MEKPADGLTADKQQRATRLQAACHIDFDRDPLTETLLRNGVNMGCRSAVIWERVARHNRCAPSSAAERPTGTAWLCKISPKSDQMAANPRMPDWR